MAQWLKLQLGDGEFAGKQLLKADTLREMHALQFSVPIKPLPAANVYAAHFYGNGLGWLIQDYRGRKIVSHGGAWGAMVAMMPEEKLGVVVLSNLDLEYLPSLLTFDVFDAYLVGPEKAWDKRNWNVWLRSEPVGAAWRPRDLAKGELEKTREVGKPPSLPLERYAGQFDSQLYGRLAIQCENGQLKLTFGQFTTPLAPWQGDSFYARSPTRLTYDWLLTFAVSADGNAENVTVKHIGWDKDEKDQVFLKVVDE
jgi:hypothetical protein